MAMRNSRSSCLFSLSMSSAKGFQPIRLMAPVERAEAGHIFGGPGCAGAQEPARLGDVPSRVRGDDTRNRAIVPYRDQHPAIGMLIRSNQESPAGFHDTDGLDVQIILIGPHPGYVVERQGFAAHIRGCDLRLFRSNPPGFLPDMASIVPSRKRRDLSCREDQGVRRTAMSVHDDAV